MKNKKIMIILGTRPEIIKFSPLIPLLEKEFTTMIVHTNQHYSPNMDSLFFKELNIREANYNLNVGSGTHIEQISKIVFRLEKVMAKEKPDRVIVLGDTNSTLGGGLVASKLNIKLGHIEAGCRSFDRTEPEEINRLIVDHIADSLFVPDKYAYNNLIREGIPSNKIFNVGSTLSDACMRNIKIASNEKMKEFGLKKEGYLLLTVHRQDNTNNQLNLKSIISAINEISKKNKVVFPIHPRTEKFLKLNNLKLNKDIIKIEALGYLDFIKLLENCKFVITDSGGVQEEAVMLNIPCLVLCNYTPWIRYIIAKKNFLIGKTRESIIKNVNYLIDDKRGLLNIKKKKICIQKNASHKIVDILKHEIQ